MTVVHNIPPVFDARSRVLVLGSFPSVKSREAAFFYAHPQNRFWPLLARLFGRPLPQSVEEKTSLLLLERVALWDVAGSCEIEGSADVSIRSARANDLDVIFSRADIRRVFTNGGTAHRLYNRLCGPGDTPLPSTSPANASWSLERLASVWQAVAEAARS